MDFLIDTAKNLSELERNQLLKLVKDQPKKKELLQLVFNPNASTLSTEHVAKKLGYSSASGAFFTLKHRLTKDLLEFKKKSSKNQITDIENRIYGLRSLLYSRDHQILEREIKELRSKVAELEIVKGQGEIFFCDYLLNYHSASKRQSIYQSMEVILQKEKLFNLAEIEFYRIIFEYQDLFYLTNSDQITSSEEELMTFFTDVHCNLQLKVTEFFMISAHLTLTLRLGTEEKQLKVLNREIERLQEIYQSNNLKQRFPNCDFAILCLFNKYHLALNNHEMFLDTLVELKAEVHKIVGYKTYEDALFYYFYVFLYECFLNQKIGDFSIEIIRLLGAKMSNSLSNRFLYFFYHLNGLAYFLDGNYKQAEKLLLKSRNHDRIKEPLNFWIVIENHLMNLTIQIKNRSYESAVFELAKLKSTIKKNKVDHPSFKAFLKSSEKLLNTNLSSFNDYKEMLNTLRIETNLFFPFSFDTL